MRPLQDIIKVNYLRYYLYSFFSGLIFILLIIVLKTISGESYKFYFRDPVATAGLTPLVGIASNIGILIWCATASICLFCWHRTRSSFLLYAGLLSGCLLIDDFFLFHEMIFPDYLHINQSVVILIYILMMLTFLINFRNEIIKSEFIGLVIAGVFFTISIVIDLKLFFGFHSMFYEDSAKFLGLVAWMTYFIRHSIMTLNDKSS